MKRAGLHLRGSHRGILVIVLVALLVVGGLALFLAPRSSKVHVRLPTPKPGAPASTATTSATALSHNFVAGISDPTLVGETAAVQQTQLQQMASIGITSVRVDANWAWVEYGGPNTYDWSHLDQEVQQIHQAGMAPELTIDGAPSWAAVNGLTSAYVQPVSAAQFAAWASAVATRYRSTVNTFEIWNEPNQFGSWQPKPNPAAYTTDLIAAYKSIKAIEPNSIVLSGGLSPGATSNGNINAVSFLKAMYADGAKGYFDAVADHPYSYPVDPNTYESWSGWSQMSQTHPSIRSVMAANGDSDKSVWITELGAPTDGPDGLGDEFQAREFTQAIAFAKKTSWVGSVYLYTWQDRGLDPGTSEDWFGLVTRSGAAKPAYNAVASALK